MARKRDMTKRIQAAAPKMLLQLQVIDTAVGMAEEYKDENSRAVFLGGFIRVATIRFIRPLLATLEEPAAGVKAEK